MNTRFGWTLSGPVENAPHSETHSVNLAATHVLQIDTGSYEMDVHEMELGAKLRTFWESELNRKKTLFWKHSKRQLLLRIRDMK